LGFGGPGLKIHALEEQSFPAPVLEGEGRIYSIFLAYSTGIELYLNFGEYPKTPKTTNFGVRLTGRAPQGRTKLRKNAAPKNE
jgi:hypothetical protein